MKKPLSRAQEALTAEQLDRLLAAGTTITPTGQRNLVLLLAEAGQLTYVRIRRGEGRQAGTGHPHAKERPAPRSVAGDAPGAALERCCT